MSDERSLAKDEFGKLVERGDVGAVRDALHADPALANQPIRWYLNQENASDPLHYVSDCVGNDLLNDVDAGEIAQMLLEFGAAINGSEGKESPMIGATSLGARSVARVLIEAGAELESTSIFGSRAIHWAAWMGLSSTVKLLIERGVEIEARCTKFGATPLFWAVDGYGPTGAEKKTGQVEAVRLLIAAGASANTTNKNGQSALERSKSCAQSDMYELLSQFAG